MRFIAIVGVLAIACIVALPAAAAPAALPKKAATYEGTLYATAQAAITKPIRVTVDATGKNGRVVWRCGTGRAPISLRFAIKPDGSFAVASKVGTITEWAFTGRFSTPTVADALLRLLTTCDGKGGKVKLTLAS